MEILKLALLELSRQVYTGCSEKGKMLLVCSKHLLEVVEICKLELGRLPDQRAKFEKERTKEISQSFEERI